MSKLHDLIERCTHFWTDEEAAVHAEAEKLIADLHASINALEARVKALEEKLSGTEPPKAA